MILIQHSSPRPLPTRQDAWEKGKPEVTGRTGEEWWWLQWVVVVVVVGVVGGG